MVGLASDTNKKLIIRAPNKAQDGVNFDFIISTIPREVLIKKYSNYSKLLLIFALGSIVFLLVHYLYL